MNQIMLFEQQEEENRRLRSLYKQHNERPMEEKISLRNTWEKPQALLEAVSSLQMPDPYPNRKIWRKQQRAGTVPKRIATSPYPASELWDLNGKENEHVRNVRESLDGGDMPPRLENKMYFVLDKEMVLNFEEPLDVRKEYLENLSKLVLPGTDGSMLYIPHIVIKQVDFFNECQRVYNTKVQIAERAIKYLNSKFDRTFEIQAQSVTEEQDYLFHVCCIEESIVNSCLQLQKEVPNLLLLTYSSRLRRSAKSMGIPVSSYPALKDKHPEAFAALQKKREPLQAMQIDGVVQRQARALY
ncbi:uncharacterized protein LOC111076270 [Drosophila obscura]|uniref:uncharacterized protein LOC111076270 n=1 Tax=Drosophila obscura TaxID=7282 RepID=UPI001BB1C6E9|nr:uncharacterized protein LOC111076270 [Drosophila obscura]XP_041449744.1 uncharacterized protein LOC111076270 [Drosophila obscura]XP_041449745.1 uncharacterized protein LOC111076270 [Drosophila obscura]